MSDENNQEQAEDAQTLEVFLVKDDPLSIPKLTIIDEDKVEITFYTGSDMCPYWLRIAYDHLLLTEKASDALAEAKERGDNEAMGDALKAELSSGMQAMMASAIAIDAFYASVKEYVAIPAKTIQAWRENKTPRYAQISEVLRLAFRLDNRDTQLQRKIIKEIFDFRDKVVHPPSGTYPPVRHPQLNKATKLHQPSVRS